MKLLVSTKRGIARRRRAGHDFGQQAQVVDCGELAKAWTAQLLEGGAKPEEAKRSATQVESALTSDDALNVTMVADDHEIGAVPVVDAAELVKLKEENQAKDEQIAALTAKVSELEGTIAKLSPSDGSRERTAKASK